MMQSRTHNCGELRAQHAGEHVKLVGWMENVREVGGSLAFVVLRDFYGTTQIVVETSELLAQIKGYNKESTISVEGTVRERASKNPNQPTGDIEVVPEKIELLGRCRYNSLPFEINRSREADETQRLKYRYLDLRNPAVKKNIILRSNVVADLRRSMVNSDYGLKYEDGRSDGKGLSHFLAGMVGMEEVIYQTDIPNAIMVPVGRDVPNPLALLTNSHFAELLDMLARMADYVIVDAPPVGVVIDAAEIAKACDGTLIAVNYNDVSRQELLDVKQQIEQTGCPILGTVLNQVDYDNYMGRKYYKSYSKYGKYGYYRKYYKRSHEAEKK